MSDKPRRFTFRYSEHIDWTKRHHAFCVTCYGCKQTVGHVFEGDKPVEWNCAHCRTPLAIFDGTSITFSGAPGTWTASWTPD